MAIEALMIGFKNNLFKNLEISDLLNISLTSSHLNTDLKSAQHVWQRYAKKLGLPQQDFESLKDHFNGVRFSLEKELCFKMGPTKERYCSLEHLLELSKAREAFVLWTLTVPRILSPGSDRSNAIPALHKEMSDEEIISRAEELDFIISNYNTESLGNLNISNNQLYSLPAEIGKFTELLNLNLSHNELRELPCELGELKRLEILDLSRNKLSKLPDNFSQLSSLKSINLSDNQFNPLPSVLLQLDHLETVITGKIADSDKPLVSELRAKGVRVFENTDTLDEAEKIEE